MSRSEPSPGSLRLVGGATLAGVFAFGLLASAVPGFDAPTMTTWTATIPRQEGARGLEVGGAVLVGGLPKGRILEVSDGVAGRNEAGRTLIAIRFELPESIVLGRDAVVRKSVGIAGTNGFLDIPDPGSRKALFTPGEPRVLAIDDSPPPGGSIGVLIGRRNGERIEEIANAGDRLETLLPARVQVVTAVAREIVDRVESLQLQAASGITGTRRRIDGLVARFGDAGDRARLLQPIVDGLRESMSELSREIARELDRWRPVVSSILGGTESIRIDAAEAMEIVDRWRPRLVDARRSLSSARTDLDAARIRLGLLGPEISDGLARTMARMVLAGGQLARATQDLLPLAIEAITTNPDRASENRDALLDAIGDVVDAGTEIRDAARRLETLSAAPNAMLPADEALDDAASEILERRVADLERLLDALDARLRAEIAPELGS